MTLRATWDRPAPTPERTAPSGGGSRWASIVSWEELLTFSLMLVALLAVVISVERANWVAEMPRLTIAALAGLLSGWVLGRTRAPGPALHLIGIAIGAVVVLGMVMQTLQLSNPELESGATARWSELWERVRIWFDQLVAGDVSTDPLPFVLLVVFAAWALAYIAAWAVVRWKNPWLALVPGGVALLTNISYLPGQPSLEFIVFLFAGILLFARLHLLSTVERWEGERAEAPQWLSLEVLNLATWLGVLLIVVAWVVPTANNWGPLTGAWEGIVGPIEGRVDRVGRLFTGINSKQPLEAHTFGPVLPLKGSIRLDPDPLFAVQADEPLYLRGATYDEYGLNGWKQTGVDERDLAPTALEEAIVGTEQTRSQFRRPVAVEVQVTDAIARDRLFAIGEPLASDRSADLLTGPAAEDIVGLGAADDDVDDGDRYTTVGSVSGATIDRLVTSSPDYPAWVTERYLQLPEDLPQEVRERARQIAGTDRVPFTIASNIERYLRENYPYSTSVGARPPLRDAVTYFLFDAQRGYFDYHASAMTVMLRSVGIPARLAIGFALDGAARDPQTNLITVSEQNSWAWTEVYFPGYGWIEFNPTPGLATVTRSTDDSGFIDPVTGLPLDDPAFDGIDPALIPPELLMQPDGAPLTSQPAAAEDSSGFNPVFAWLLAAAALIVVAAGAGRFVWVSAFRGLSPASQRWAKLQTLAGWAGYPTHEEQTPNEAAAALSTSIRPRMDVSPLARSYVVERYGGTRPRNAAEQSAELDALYLQARGRLAKRVFRRFLRFGR